MPAAFEGSSFLLTYPQLEGDKSLLFDFLCQLADVRFVKVAQESHQDGGTHFHAVVLFSKRVRLATRAFDFEGKHPNVKNVGRKKSDWDNCIKYLDKEDPNPLEWGTPRHEASVWSAIAKATSRQEAEELLLNEKPRDYVLNARNFDYWLDKKFPKAAGPVFTPRPADSFVLPESIVDWLSGNFRYVFSSLEGTLTLTPAARTVTNLKCSI